MGEVNSKKLSLGLGTIGREYRVSAPDKKGADTLYTKVKLTFLNSNRPKV